jgi:alkylation response protein AidB-like acyl-CoA dehydrogenase
MTTIDIEPRQDLLDRAAAVGRDIAEHTADHDRDGTFVSEAFDHLRDAGLLAMAVPAELGGDGATIRQVAAVQQELGRHDGSVALASAMHQHVVAFTAWRYHRGMPGAEATLRRIADDGIVLLSTGGGDFTRPRGAAVRVDGGYLVSGTKPFVSQAPVGAVLSTMFVLDDPERGRRVLNMAVPVASDGVVVLDDWDALGMRGTGSHSVTFHDVFVPDERVLADRPYGTIDGPLQVIVSIAMPIISAAYLGVARAAFEAAARSAVAGADDPLVQRQVGLMAHRLQVAQWSLDGALDLIGDDPIPSLEGLAAALAAKREVALAGVEVTDLAMEVAGGSAYFRGSPIERAYRDVRAAKFHPLTPEVTLVHAGRMALGLPADEA